MGHIQATISATSIEFSIFFQWQILVGSNVVTLKGLEKAQCSVFRRLELSNGGDALEIAVAVVIVVSADALLRAFLSGMHRNPEMREKTSEDLSGQDGTGQDEASIRALP